MAGEDGTLVGSGSVSYSSHNWGGFAMNQETGYHNGSVVNANAKSGEFKKPSQTYAMSDACYYHMTAGLWGHTYPFVVFRHNNGLNILFMDGHAEWRGRFVATSALFIKNP